MAIDRNERARLGARLRADRRITHATFRVAQAALFGCMDARNGRCQAYRARLAHEAGCHVDTVSAATKALEAAGYVRVVPTYGARRRQEGGRWFRPRGANVLEWLVPASFFLKGRSPAGPKPSFIKEAPAALPDRLAAVLARLGTAIADKAGLPGGAGAG
jgi:hypothetical protein